MYCNHCGKQNSATAKFCSACGSALATMQASASPNFVPSLQTDIIGKWLPVSVTGCGILSPLYSKALPMIEFFPDGTLACSRTAFADLALIYAPTSIVLETGSYRFADSEHIRLESGNGDSATVNVYKLTLANNLLRLNELNKRMTMVFRR